MHDSSFKFQVSSYPSCRLSLLHDHPFSPPGDCGGDSCHRAIYRQERRIHGRRGYSGMGGEFDAPIIEGDLFCIIHDDAGKPAVFTVEEGKILALGMRREAQPYYDNFDTENITGVAGGLVYAETTPSAAAGQPLAQDSVYLIATLVATDTQPPLRYISRKSQAGRYTLRVAAAGKYGLRVYDLRAKKDWQFVVPDELNNPVPQDEVIVELEKHTMLIKDFSIK